MSRRRKMLMRILSGSIPWLNSLGRRWRVRGRLNLIWVSCGGVIGSANICCEEPGEREMDEIVSPGSPVGEDVESGVMRAQDGLRPILDLMLSMSTLRNGSGSVDSMASCSSGLLGLYGLANFDGVNVTCGR